MRMVHLLRRSLRPLAFVIAPLLMVLTSAGSMAQDHAALSARLRTLVAEAGLGEGVSISVADAATGEVIFAHQADTALNPASNQKLVTAAVALEVLGADHAMLTGLYGRIEGDGVVGGLVLRGLGDPSLNQADLVELARDLADRGVRRVDRLIVDASFFDDQLLPPAFDQQPGEVAPFRAATGAVSVDVAAYSLRILPGSAVGEPARVRLDGAGYFDLDNAITTGEPGSAPNVIADQRDGGERMRLILRGSVALGTGALTYRRRIENPLYWTGHVMRDVLAAVGIRVGEGVTLGTAGDRPLLASHRSAPLSHLLDAMGKDSDNYVAEMVFRAIGATRRTPATTDNSVAVVTERLGALGIDTGSFAVVNGSGLFRGNRIASSHLVRVLCHVYQSPAMRNEFVAHLAIAGVDGTLERRLSDLPAPRIVRAKTGTLNDAIALSGYVLGRDPGRAIAFSVLMNGVSGRHGVARDLADGVARAIAEDLWR
jgi:D-alanyl-D-alanine carboxypeptidase/D-alanyl-D-alanine-endopeptidase (penicillin-binding protein 4)